MAPFRTQMSADQTALVPASAVATQQTHVPVAAMTAGAAGATAASTALTAAAATAATAAGRTQAPQGFGQVTNSKRKQASVVEMLEYVKSLDIDPIKESDLLWIAEEAFNAALPPGWSEHQDEEGRVYFHNGATGESVWRHPMDDLFKEVVEYQRSVVKNGGFHLVEDEIAELEESIRRDLADWMELFDEHGEKFFYNRRTDDSRFDDPRMAVYHNLYARIKMVAKMKERLPVLARAPRPEEPTRQEMELRRRQQEEEDRYLKCLVKVQSLVRVLVAKRKYKIKVAQATIQKGPQPLRGKLRLRMEKLGDGQKRELVLAMTTPHRRNRAAMKIQARARGMLARKKFRPLVLHRAFLSKIVTKIQTRSRVWLAKRAVVRAREARVERASVDIQRVWRGHREKTYVSTLRAQKARYDHYYMSVVFIQKRVRVFLERKRLKEKYQRKFVAACLLIQKQVKVMRAKEQLTQLRLEAEPIQAVFHLNRDPASRGVMPWTWQMWMVPWLGRPTAALPDGAEEEEEEPEFQNMFSKVTPADYQNVAATRMQSLARGKESRNRVKQLREVAGEFFEDLFGTFWKTVDRRRYAAIKIQALRRMYLVRREGLIAKMKLEHLGKCEEKLVFVQASFLKYVEQARLLHGMTADAKTSAAVRLQAAWRGWLARKHTDRIREEALWTMKGWFEYTATGRDACQVEVKFVPNPSFDDYKHFVAHGPPAMVALDYSIEDLEDQLKMSIAHIETLLGGPLHGAPVTSSGGKDRPASNTSSAMGKRNQAEMEAPSRNLSKISRVGSARPLDSSSNSASPSRNVLKMSAAAPLAAGSAAAPASRTPSLAPPGAAAELREAKAIEAERRKAKAKELEKWLQIKEDEVKKKKEKDKEMMQQILQRDQDGGQAAVASSSGANIEPAAIGQGQQQEQETASSTTTSWQQQQPQQQQHQDQDGGQAAVASSSGANIEPAAIGQGQQQVQEQETTSSTATSWQQQQQQHQQHQEREKAETMKKNEQDRIDQRERRLRIGERQKAKMESQMMHSKNSRTPSLAPPGAAEREKAETMKKNEQDRIDQRERRLQIGERQKVKMESQMMHSKNSRTPSLAPPGAAAGATKYGGSVVNGKFVRSLKTSVDDLTEEERAAINADLEAQRIHRATVIAERAKAHKAKQAKEQAAKTNKFQAELREAEAIEAERRKAKAKELKKWLQIKEDEVKKKKEKDKEMMQQILQREREKAETMKKNEQDRIDQRERRLRIGERQKAKMESQMMHSKNSRSSPALMAQQSSRDSVGNGASKAQLQSLDPAEFGGGGRYDPIAQGKLNDFDRLPQIDQGATTPTQRRAYSHAGVVGDPLRMSKTQEAFKHPHLPALPLYQRGMEMAIGSYSDSGRPQRLRGHGH